MGVLYFVFSHLVSKWAGLMAVFLILFCSAGVTVLFFSGTIFSIVNVFIVLPLGLYFVIKWLTCQRVYQAVLAILLLVAFSLLHPTGAYLLPVLLIFFAITLCSKRYRNYRTIIVFALLLIITALSVSTQYKELQIRLAHPTVLVSVGEFITKYVRIAVGLLLGFAVLFLIKRKEQIEQHTQLLIIMLGSIVVVLVPVAFIGFSLGRSILDLAGIIALLTACLLGIIVKQDKMHILAPALFCVAIVGGIPMLKVWIFGIGVPG